MTPQETFNADEYPEGRRCACCRNLFEDGQTTVRWFAGDMWTFLSCVPCAESDAPLCDDHPLRDAESVLLRGDGRVVPR